MRPSSMRHSLGNATSGHRRELTLLDTVAVTAFMKSSYLRGASFATRLGLGRREPLPTFEPPNRLIRQRMIA
jgi:hypothetical protein